MVMDRCFKLQPDQQIALSKLKPAQGAADRLTNAKTSTLRRVALSDGTCCYSPRYQHHPSERELSGRGALRVIALILFLLLLLQWTLPIE
jgi:hypothetical protein